MINPEDSVVDGDRHYPAKTRLLRSTLIFLFALSGCGGVATHEARDEWGKLVGAHLQDIISCEGDPDKTRKTGPDTAIAQWNSLTSTNPGLRITVPLLGSIEAGAGAPCSMVITVLRDGTAVYVAFPRAGTTLGGGPYAGCYDLVRECLDHLPDTGQPKGYDAFSVLKVEDASASEVKSKS